MTKVFNISILILFISCLCKAQEGSNPPKDFDVYRPKVIQFSYSSLVDYETSSVSDRYGNSNTEFRSDNQLKLRIGAPLILKEKTKLGVQLKYETHRFILDDAQNADYDLFSHLNNTVFRSAAARFLYEKTLSNGSKVKLLAGTEIKSDVLKWTLGSSNNVLGFEWKKTLNSRTKIGAGIASSYAIGIFQAYPLFMYERKLHNRWTLDLRLPKAVSLRYRANEGLYIIGKTTFRGWRYNVNNALQTGMDHHMLRRSSLEVSLNIEKEIHDWLWIGVNAGLMKNINYYLAEPGKRRRDALINLSADDMRFIKASIFIVPPKKFYK